MKISLSQLFVLALVMGLVISVVMSKLDLAKKQRSIDILSDQLRYQLEINGYSMNARLIANGKNFLVYSIDVESTFRHAIRFSSIQDDGTTLLCKSYVDPKSNTWSNDLVISAIKSGKTTDYYVSGVFGVPEGEVTLIGTLTGELPDLQGFGESGQYVHPLSLTLISEGSTVGLPFKTELLCEGRRDGESSQENDKQKIDN